MQSVIFSSGNDAFQVSKIIYAGPIAEIPPDRQKSGSTHSFKMITSSGAVYCHYKDIETAKKARGILTGMIETVKPHVFKSGFQCIDVAKVVSFGKVFPLKNSQNGMTHGFVVSVETATDENRKLWMTYSSEDHAEKARKALYAQILSANGVTRSNGEQTPQPAPVPVAATTDGMPF
jgi:hypothetical protein